VALPNLAASGPDAVGAGEIAALKAELARQGEQIEALRTLVQRLVTELGLP
jgi:hypothetical protein